MVSSRYTCMLSALMIAPAVCRARASASADLPDAVGPAIRIGRSSSSMGKGNAKVDIAAVLADMVRVREGQNEGNGMPTLDETAMLVAVAAPGSGALDATAIANLRRQIADLGRRDASLATDEAHMFELAPAPAQAWTALRDAARDAVGDRPIDINLVVGRADQRRKRLLIADMESTIIAQEMLDELGDMIGARGRIEAITARAMRGELDFEAALVQRVSLLAGLDARVLDDVALRITDTPGARTLVATMRAGGGHAALVSGGFTVFTQSVATRLGFDEHRANTLEIANGRIVGGVRPPILGRAAKLAALDEITQQLGVTRAQAIAVGDGANDLAMLQAAGLGVAFRAKPIVAAAAHVSVVHGDLTSLLYLQGYHRAEFRS
jgi:phosphoserine phosphatase